MNKLIDFYFNTIEKRSVILYTLEKLKKIHPYSKSPNMYHIINNEELFYLVENNVKKNK
jgi:hypothetical protein